MAGVNVEPIDRVRASVAVGEIVYPDQKWQENVANVAERIGNFLYSSDAEQVIKTNELIFGISGLANTQELVNVSKLNPDNLQLNLAVDGLAQATALAILVKGNLDQKDALMSGDIDEVRNNLPRGMEPLAEHVAMVMVPGEVVNVASSLNKKITGNSKIDQKYISLAINDIGEIVGNSPLPRDNIQMEMARRVINRLQRRVDQLDIGVANPQNREYPQSAAEQLALARGLFNKIDSTIQTTSSIALSIEAGQLDRMSKSGEISESVALEIRSRLKLHDCWVLMKKSNGYINPPERGGDIEASSVGAAASRAEGLGHVLDNEALDFLLKSGANGIPVDYAWDMYQVINCNYRQFLTGNGLTLTGVKTVVDNDPNMGTIDATFYTDSDPARKARVEEIIINAIQQQRQVDLTIARKSWEMAKKLAIATGENSVFNAAMAGNDEMAEDMYLKLYRKSRAEKGRQEGPVATVDHIVGIGNSWLRKASGRLAYDAGGVKPLFARDIVLIPRIVTNLDGTKEKFGIEDGNYVYHFGVWWSAKIHPLRGLLVDRKPDPKQIINRDYFKIIVDYFNNGDPDGTKRLRRFWLAGVLDLASSIDELGWTQKDISKFRQYATEVKMSEQAGVFFPQREFDEIVKILNSGGKIAGLEGQRIVNRFFGAVTGTK